MEIIGLLAILFTENTLGVLITILIAWQIGKRLRSRR